MLTYLFIGGDIRMAETYSILKSEDERTMISGMDNLPGHSDISVEKTLEYAASSENVILPVPYTRDGKNIYTPNSRYEFSVRDIISCVKGNIFYGASSAQKKLPGINILETAFYAENNARLTSECTAELIEEKYGKDISRADIMICGFGKVGSNLAQVFSKHTSSVTVAVRKENVMADILKAGYNSLDISRLNDMTDKFDIIVNTVPAHIFSSNGINRLKASSLVVDLASYPFGLDHDRYDNKNIVLELGLPGKMRPCEEAAAIHNVITGKREGKSIETQR